MKRSVEWHEECFKNSTDFQEREEQALKNFIRSKTFYLERIKADNIIRKEQLLKAKKLGLKEYDADKFNKPRKRVKV